MQEKRNKRDVVFALFLIFIGAIFLLNTTGVVGWGIWQNILRFWPVFLILGGVKLIFEKSPLAELIIGVLALILFASVAIFSYISYTSQTLPFIPARISQYIRDNPNLFSESSGENIKEEEKICLEEYDIEDVEERILNIDVGASKFTLADNPELEEYLDLQSSFSEGFIEPDLKSKIDNNSLNIFFRTKAVPRFVFWGSTQSSEFNMTLGQTEIQTDLDIKLGAGRGEVSLENLNIRNIETNVGAGRLDLSFRDIAIPESLNIQLGAGKMTVVIPENIGYELSYDLGVGRIRIDGENVGEFIGQDSSFKSSNFEDAEQIIKIEANVGVGSLEINQE